MEENAASIIDSLSIIARLEARIVELETAAAAGGAAIDFTSYFLMKGTSFLAALCLIVAMLSLFRWLPALQKLILPFFDGVQRMEKRADQGEPGANAGLGIAHGLVTAGIFLAAAIVSGVAH